MGILYYACMYVTYICIYLCLPVGLVWSASSRAGGRRYYNRIHSWEPPVTTLLQQCCYAVRIFLVQTMAYRMHCELGAL